MLPRLPIENAANRHVSIAIVGAPKCATTSLLRYLGQHPELHAHPQAECDYFLDHAEFERGWPAAHARYYPKDPGPPARLVAKRALMLYDADSIDRLLWHHPRVAVVALLRNPVDRAYSAYRYARLRGWQTSEPFETAIGAELVEGPSHDADRHGPGGYLSTGVYVWHVRRLVEVVPSGQVHVLTTEEIAAGADPVWTALFAAAGVDTAFRPELAVRHNVGAQPRSERLARLLASKSGAMGVVRGLASDRVLDRARRVASSVIAKPAEPPQLAQATRERLEEFFAPFNRQLEELLGRPTGWG